MTAPDLAGLCERLRATEDYPTGSDGRDTCEVPINPDGPEAAAAIERLVAALEPFAEAAARIRPDDPENDRPALAKVRDYRHARTALEGASDDR